MSEFGHVQTLVVRTKDGAHELCVSQAPDWFDTLQTLATAQDRVKRGPAKLVRPQSIPRCRPQSFAESVELRSPATARSAKCAELACVSHSRAIGLERMSGRL
jgi:hypothetical protein